MKAFPSLIVLSALAIGCSTAPVTYEPISGAEVAPFEQAKAVCANRKKAQEWGVVAGDDSVIGGAVATHHSFESCMAQYGWVRQTRR